MRTWSQITVIHISQTLSHKITSQIWPPRTTQSARQPTIEPLTWSETKVMLLWNMLKLLSIPIFLLHKVYRIILQPLRITISLPRFPRNNNLSRPFWTRIPIAMPTSNPSITSNLLHKTLAKISISHVVQILFIAIAVLRYRKRV